MLAFNTPKLCPTLFFLQLEWQLDVIGENIKKPMPRSADRKKGNSLILQGGGQCNDIIRRPQAVPFHPENPTEVRLKLLFVP